MGGAFDVFGPEMFGHLVANTQVWLIEREVSGTTRYYHDTSDNNTVLWTKKRAKAKKFQKKDHVMTAWEASKRRGTPKQHRLAHILEEAAKG